MKICRTFDKTAKLLEKVLNNDSEAAVLLANEVHRDVELQEVPGNRRLMPRDLEIKVQDLGIWIDPIGNRTNLSFRLARFTYQNSYRSSRLYCGVH